MAKLAGWAAGGALLASLADTGLPAAFTSGCLFLATAHTGRAGLFSLGSFAWYFCIGCGSFF